MSQSRGIPRDQPAADGLQQALLDFAVSHSPAIFYIGILEGDAPVRFISGNVEEITGHPQSAFLTLSLIHI